MDLQKVKKQKKRIGEKTKMSKDIKIEKSEINDKTELRKYDFEIKRYIAEKFGKTESGNDTLEQKGSNKIEMENSLKEVKEKIEDFELTDDTIKEIRKNFGEIELDEDNFYYKFLVSSTIPEAYIYYDDDKIVDAHLHHIISDMYEDGWYLLACKGELIGDVKGVFLFQKAKVRH